MKTATFVSMTTSNGAGNVSDSRSSIGRRTWPGTVMGTAEEWTTDCAKCKDEAAAFTSGHQSRAQIEEAQVLDRSQRTL